PARCRRSHSPDAAAWLRLHRAGNTVVVEVIDAGPGFEPCRLQCTRYGGGGGWLRLHRAGNTVVVEVIDAGPGFDPGRIPSHRYGLRESVVGRMASIGRSEEGR